jgi:aconitate hydratase
MKNSFETLATLTVDGRTYRIHRLDALEKRGFAVSRLPYSLRILLENHLRCEDGFGVTAAQIESLARWSAKAVPSHEIAFTPARVLLQDFTGVPAVVDLAAMRDAIRRMGGNPKKINPLFPAELVIDHSVQVDEYGTPGAFAANTAREYERNRERYAFLRWGSTAFDNFKVVPPETGIVHQVNLEHLARVVMTAAKGTEPSLAYPDTVVGTDSHTTMINGLGVLGWGVGGIEAEAAMLGQPMSMLIPQVVGFRLFGRLAEGATATDAVLTVTQMLRRKGVVGKFVEFFGPGLADLPLADRATIANMAPEYGATCGIFPVDGATLDYLALTGRPKDRIALVERYMKEQGLFRTGDGGDVEYSDTLELDLGTVEACLAGPKRPQDRVRLGDVKKSFLEALPAMMPAKTGAAAGAAAGSAPSGSIGGAVARVAAVGGSSAGAGTAAMATVAGPAGGVTAEIGGETVTLGHGAVVIAAITSCTNTSNPFVMLAAGLVAKKAVAKGLRTKPWVKTSLGPGSKAVTEYMKAAGLSEALDALGFNLVGYGCTTCIGNSGPLPQPVSRAIEAGGLVAASVLSGNRNFEGRVHAEVRANYLASPPLVVAYALAGRMDLDLRTEPIGSGKDGKPVMLADIWPSQAEVAKEVGRAVRADMFRASYADVYAGDASWQALQVPKGDTYAWDAASTYVKEAPYFIGMPNEPAPVKDIAGARVLAVFGDSITTDHISPAGSIKPASPAGQYLQKLGVPPAEFNSYGARRGNHEVMMRGTFANVRIKNLMLPGVEGGETLHLPDGGRATIYDAAMKYRDEAVPLMILAGKEYGSGSSRDWAAKGPLLLGVRAVIAESFERIHRSNLVGMGILPLEFRSGESVGSLGLTGREVFAIKGVAGGVESGFKVGGGGREVSVEARREDGSSLEFLAVARLDTPQEIVYYRHGGILHFVLRQLLKA